MANFSESFTNVSMDLNENPSNDEHQVNNDFGELPPYLSTKVENATFCEDRAFADSTNTTQSSLYRFETLLDESKDNSCNKNASSNNNDKNFDSGIYEPKNTTFNKENFLDSNFGNMNLSNCNVISVTRNNESDDPTVDINLSNDSKRNTPSTSSNLSFGDMDSSKFGKVKVVTREFAVNNMSAGDVNQWNCSKVDIPEIVNLSSADINLSKTGETVYFEMENTEHCAFVTECISNEPCPSQADFIEDNIDEPTKDEEFQDAVQFFKDPSSYDFLENAGGNSNEPFNPRSSLYMKFDPLASKINIDLSKRSNDIKIITEEESFSEDNEIESNTYPVNEHLDKITSSRHSVGNILISFDSPIATSNSQSLLVEKTQVKPAKLYTEEEHQQALKIRELTVQEAFLKNQQDLEMVRTKKMQEMESKIVKQNVLISVLSSVLTDAVGVVHVFADKQKDSEARSNEDQKEIAKLKEDLKIAAEDLQKFESTFADFHKRYEISKSMLSDYKQNEDHQKQQLESMTVKLQEKDEMYKALQSRTEEMVDKANAEVANVKKASDAQVAVLKAQLKKADLKISSLESDVKHTKIENEKLSSICDDLMVKVSES